MTGTVKAGGGAAQAQVGDRGRECPGTGGGQVEGVPRHRWGTGGGCPGAGGGQGEGVPRHRLGQGESVLRHRWGEGEGCPGTGWGGEGGAGYMWGRVRGAQAQLSGFPPGPGRGIFGCLAGKGPSLTEGALCL